MSPLRTGLAAAAFVVVELQNDLVHESHIEERGLSAALARAVKERGVLPKLGSVLSVARKKGLPVLYATKERHPRLPPPDTAPIYRMGKSGDFLRAGTWGARVVDEIAPQPEDVVLPRLTSLDPSVGSELWAVARRLRLDTLVVAGISTNIAVEGTVRAAANRGFRVVVVEDCCASVPEEWHRFSVEHILPLLAEVAASDEIIAALEVPSE